MSFDLNSMLKRSQDDHFRPRGEISWMQVSPQVCNIVKKCCVIKIKIITSNKSFQYYNISTLNKGKVVVNFMSKTIRLEVNRKN